MQHTNRLIDEASPYLLQHAHNPVDWRAWGPNAFDAARAQDKPIFLSVGYSTCYWCHVMERECFENEAIAAIMNEHFINIKVDREERPDVDDVYMTAVQLMTHQGGWPMSVFLEPHGLTPFLGGTYFPPEDRHGRAGFPSVLRQIAKVWQEQRETVMQQAEHVAEAVKAALSQDVKHAALRPQHVEQAVRVLMRTYDEANAGFGGSSGPKFPMPANVDLLINTQWDKPQVKRAALHTLDRMAIGGMYDHIGGGFHRYSVDEKWLVPHFEKMLYDNGQLLSTYARAYELTHEPLYGRVLRQASEYVLREMTDECGPFHSAQDAEVNHREGENYLWTATQVREALAEVGEPELSELALDVYGFNRGTNFRDPHHPEDGPKNVVHLIDMPQPLAASRGLDLNTFFAQLDRINAILLQARTTRDQPGTDDKVIAGWNGLMIAGLADAGRVLGEPRFVDAAKRAAGFVLGTMRRNDGGLIRTWRRGKAGSDAFLEDYAFMVQGLLALHRATSDEQLLQDAMALTDAARTSFWDSEHGGYYNTLAEQPDLFVRTKGIYDGAAPAGNSVMMLNLLRLRELTGERRFLDDAVATMRCFASYVAERPTGAVLSVLALHRLLDEHPEAMKPLASGDDGEIASDIVRVTIEPRHVDLRHDDEAAIRLTLHIAADYHVNSHQPGLDFLVPLSVELEENGIELDVQYPSGTRYSGLVSGGEAMYVHTGTVIIPLRVRKLSEGGLPVLTLRYQACTDEACLEPREVVLPLTFTS